MSSDDKRAAVYTPFSTFKTSLDALKQGIPPKIDTSVWPTQSGGVRGQLISAYKFLGLIDDEGNVQKDLKPLVEAGEEGRKSILFDILSRSYPTIIDLGKSNASSAQLEVAMRQYNAQGDTLKKAIRFYLQAAEYAGLPISVHWGHRRTKGTGTTRTTRRSPKKPGKTTEGPKPPAPPAQPEQNMMAVEMPSGGAVRLVVTVDVTRLTSDERSFLFDLIDRMRGFEDQQKRPQVRPSEAGVSIRGGEA